MSRSIAVVHGVQFTLSPALVRRTVIDALRVAVVALPVAGVDMMACMAYWQLHGVDPSVILRSMAAWVLGPRPPETAAVLAAGLSVHYLIYLSMVAVFRCTLARRDESGTRRMAVAGMYGVVAYAAVFLVLVPALVFPQRLNQSPGWITACVLLHGLVLGPLMSWLLRWRRTA